MPVSYTHLYPIIFDGDKTQSWGMAAIIIGARGAEDKDVLLAHSGVDPVS